MSWLRKFWHDRRAEMDEAAFVIPVLLLVTFGLINFGMLGYASVSASSANRMLSGTTVGSYQVNVSGGGSPASLQDINPAHSAPHLCIKDINYQWGSRQIASSALRTA